MDEQNQQDDSIMTEEKRARLENITVVLHRPKYAGNIGSAARCAMNMGIEKLVVVDHPHPDGEAMKQMATHAAAEVIEGIRYFDDLPSALEDFHYVVGTTARRGNSNLRRVMVGPGEMAEALVDLSRNNEVALVFGPEDRGLSNEELDHCHLLVSIPTSDRFRSLNLSHAVMILCYEIFRASRDTAGRFTPRLATSGELEDLYAHMKEALRNIDFLRDENPDYWMVAVRRFLSRVPMFSRDVKILRGVCRQLNWFAEKQRS